jgi:hypothetical protein
MGYYWHQLMLAIEHMHMQHWLWVLTVAALIGILCMRGFGSRTNY